MYRDQDNAAAAIAAGVRVVYTSGKNGSPEPILYLPKPPEWQRPDPGESSFMQELKATGQATIYVWDAAGTTPHAVTVWYDPDQPPFTVDAYDALVREGSGPLGPQQEIVYRMRDDGTFFPVLRNPRVQPLTPEDDARIEQQGDKE